MLNGSLTSGGPWPWDLLIPQAENHLLGPRLHRMVLASSEGLSLSPPHLLRLEQSQILSHRIHLLGETYLKKLLDLFENEKIPVICLKGWAFAQRYYSVPTDRGFYDLDLLFKPQHRTRVTTLLEQTGYRLTSGLSDWVAVSHKDEFQSVGHSSPPVECHYGLGYGKFQFSEEIWERSVLYSAPAGFKVRVLNPQDEYLFLTFHLGVQHRFQKLGWLLDLIQMRKRGFYPTHVPDSLKAAVKYTEKLIADCKSSSPSPLFCAIALGHIERSGVRKLVMRAKLQGGVLALFQYLWGRTLFSWGLERSIRKKRIGALATERLFTTLLELPLEQMKKFVFSANGSSMIPTIVLGDRLHAKRLKGKPKVGDIVVCRDEVEKWRVHRVVAVSPEVQTKGDALFDIDPTPKQIAAVVYRVEKTWISRLRRFKLRLQK